MSRVIENLEVDRLRRWILLKKTKRGKGKLLKLQEVASGEQGVMVGWAGGVARLLVVVRPLGKVCLQSNRS